MLPWINKARQNDTKNTALLHELKKVQVMSTSETKYQIDRHELATTDALIAKRHARFVMPDSAEADNKTKKEFTSMLNKI